MSGIPIPSSRKQASNGFNKGGGIRLSFGQSVDNNNLRVMLLSNAVAPPPPSPKSSQGGGYNPRAPESITIALGIHRKSIGIRRESVVDP